MDTHLRAQEKLDEPALHPVLGEVADVGMPRGMGGQGLRQAERIPVGDEAGVDPGRLDPAAPLGDPQCRVILAAEPGPDVLDVVGDRLHRPAHHRCHVPPPRRLPLLRLAVADAQHPVPAELRGRRVAAPVRQVQLRCLRAAQAPPVHDLEQGRVPVSRQRALPPPPHRAVDLLVGIVEEPLHLLPGEGPGLRIALVVVQVRDRIPLVADRHRVLAGAELLLASRRPAVPSVHEELGELPQRALVGPDRRRGQVLLGSQVQRPLVHVTSRPLPRVLPGELADPAPQPLPQHDRVLPQPPRRLLGTPPRSIASTIASSGCSCATPDTSSRRAAPARSPRPTRPPSPRNRNRLTAGSCIKRDARAPASGNNRYPRHYCRLIRTPCIAANPGKTRPSNAIPEIWRRRRPGRGRSPSRPGAPSARFPGWRPRGRPAARSPSRWPGRPARCHRPALSAGRNHPRRSPPARRRPEVRARRRPGPAAWSGAPRYPARRPAGPRPGPPAPARSAPVTPAAAGCAAGTARSGPRPARRTSPPCTPDPGRTTAARPGGSPPARCRPGRRPPCGYSRCAPLRTTHRKPGTPPPQPGNVPRSPLRPRQAQSAPRPARTDEGKATRTAAGHPRRQPMSDQQWQAATPAWQTGTPTRLLGRG